MHSLPKYSQIHFQDLGRTLPEPHLTRIVLGLRMTKDVRMVLWV
jgi:hypothetical protein